MRDLFRALALTASGVVLAACQSGGAEVVTAMSQETAQTSYVESVEVNVAVGDAPAGLGSTLKAELMEEASKCATGSEPLTLEAHIVQYEGPDAFKTWVIGHSATLRGSARLLASDGSVVGDYDISQSIGGGGLIAAAAMADAQTTLTDQFAKELCRQAFGRDPSSSAQSNMGR